MTESRKSGALPACSGAPGIPDVNEHLLLYLADELDAKQRAAVEAHVQECAACAATLASEHLLIDWIAAAEPAKDLDASGAMLARARSELVRALDEHDEAIADRADGARRAAGTWRARFSAPAWMPKLRSAWALHPAASGVLLLAFGFALGIGVPEWIRVSSSRAPAKPSVVVNAAPRLSEQELHNVDSVGLNWETPQGSSAPRVQLQLNSDKQPMQLEGSPDDADIERVLTFVIANGQRFDPGVLLDSVDLLAAQVADPAVRAALCGAAGNDPNPGVRLKAIEALRGYGRDAQVQQVLLDALDHDDNSGVRVEAVNALSAALESSSDGAAANGASQAAQDPRVEQVLRRSSQNDSNRYVRMTAAATLQQIDSNQPAFASAAP